MSYMFGCTENIIPFKVVETLDEARNINWTWGQFVSEPDEFTWNFQEGSINIHFPDAEFALLIEVNEDNIIQINDERIPLLFFKEE